MFSSKDWVKVTVFLCYQAFSLTRSLCVCVCVWIWEKATVEKGLGTPWDIFFSKLIINVQKMTEVNQDYEWQRHASFFFFKFVQLFFPFVKMRLISSELFTWLRWNQKYQELLNNQHIWIERTAYVIFILFTIIILLYIIYFSSDHINIVNGICRFHKPL